MDTGAAHQSGREGDSATRVLVGGRFLGNRLLHHQGEVGTWRGVDLSTGAPILLKAVALHALEPGAVERIFRSHSQLRELRGNGVCSALHWGVEDHHFFQVTPVPPGELLSERLARGPLSVEESLQVGCGLLRALKKVHAQGVLHRHLHPSQVLLHGGPRPEPVLTGFGLAPEDLRESSLRALPLTAVQALAPEQTGLVDAEVGPAADLYAVGVLLFECLAGEPPFQGAALGELLRQHLTVSPELRARGVLVPRALEQAVQHLLCKDPWERYQSAAAALEDLEAIAAELARGVSEPTVVIGQSDRRRRLTEPAFVGRGSELKMLEEALDAAVHGQGGLVLVEGGSGSGKTMLLDELARHARARGVWVLRGQGLPPAPQRPLQEFDGIVRDLQAAMKASPDRGAILCARMGGHSEALCEVLPHLADHRAELEPQKLGPEQLAEDRTVNALRTLLDALGEAERPALVLFDDCQWADELTLKLLQSWPPPEEPSRRERFVMVVSAFRTEELPEGHALRKLEAAHRITVPPLEALDVRHLAESMAGPLPAEAVHTVVRLSDGNPLTASAVVRGLVESGALVPGASGWSVVSERLPEVHSTRQAACILLHRLGLLPEGLRRLLMTGAVLGREFEVELAAALARQSVSQAEAALEEARQRHIVWPAEQAGRYTFAHDKVREAFLEGLPGETARALHHEAALELERRAPDRSFEIASHFEAAGAPQRAWPHALEAARQARRRHALALAEHYYRLADQGAEKADSATRLSILEELGETIVFRTCPLEAEACFKRAQAFATTRLDFARLEGLRGDAAQERMDLRAAIRGFTQALQLLGRRVPRHGLLLLLGIFWELGSRMLHVPRRGRHTAPSRPCEGEARLEIDLLTRLSQASWLHPHAKLICLWAHLRGLNLVERYAPTPTLAAAYAHHGTLLFFTQEFLRLPRALTARAQVRGERYFHQALALRRTFGNIFATGHTLFLYQYALLHASRSAESIDVGNEAQQLLQRAGCSHFSLAAVSGLGLAHFMRGELSVTFALGQSLQRGAPQHRGSLYSAVGLQLQTIAAEGHLPREPLASALERTANAPRGSIDQLSHLLLRHAEARRLLAAGEAARAATTLSKTHKYLRRNAMAPPTSLPWLVTALREAAEQVPSYDAARRARLLREARVAARRMLGGRDSGEAASPQLLRELGLIAATTGRPRRARRAFDRSLAIAERLGLRYERALTLRTRGQVGTALGWPEAAADTEAGEAELLAMRSALEPFLKARPHTSLSLVDRFPKLLEAGRAIASALTRDAVFKAVREAMQGLLRGEESLLVEVTPEGAAPPALEEALRPFLQRALETRGCVVPSLEELEDAGRTAVRSALFAPILVRGQVVALFGVLHRKASHVLGAEETRIAEFIATLAGAALENAQGFAEVNALSEERERLYQQAQAALRKRDEFLVVASHELRTPFTPMRLYLQGLLNALRKPGLPASLEPWVAKLELANTRLQRLARLVEDLFDVSRLAHRQLPLRRGEVELSALALEAVDRWQEELARAGCECTVEAPAPVRGHWDGLRLEQVLDNLLSNAMKYGPGQPIHLTVKQDGDRARLIVRDHGMGIAREDQARIFERFERAVSENYGGFGLGLWISREVVEAHGGRLSVESAPGQGATFTVELPLTAAPVEGARAPQR